VTDSEWTAALAKTVVDWDVSLVVPITHCISAVYLPPTRFSLMGVQPFMFCASAKAFLVSSREWQIDVKVSDFFAPGSETELQCRCQSPSWISGYSIA
jgi:hypothetical protein